MRELDYSTVRAVKQERHSVLHSLTTFAITYVYCHKICCRVFSRIDCSTFLQKIMLLVKYLIFYQTNMMSLEGNDLLSN